MTEAPLYLFCVAEGSEPPRLEHGLAAVSAGGLHAVVRPVDPAEFAAVAAIGGEVSEALAELLLRHDVEIRAVFATHNLLPMRFGVAIAGQAALEKYLTEQAAPLRGALDRVRDCEEWGVYFEPPEPEPEPLAVVGTAGGPPTSGSGYLRRRQADLAAARRQGAEFRALAQTAHQALAELAPECQVAATPGRPGAAYLVARSAASAFAATAEAQCRRLEAAGAHMRVTGPWPPYSFCGSRSPGAE